MTTRSHTGHTEVLRHTLLIEDDPADVRLLQEMLADAGFAGRYQVSPVGSLEAARQWLQHQTPEVAVVDLGLPDATGVAGFRQARQLLADVPALVLTGSEDHDIGRAAVREGAQDFLVKGQLTAAEFDRAVRYAVERHGQQTRTLRRQDLLLQISRRAMGASGLGHVLDVAANALTEAVGARRSVVAEHLRGRLAVRAGVGLPEAPPRQGDTEPATWTGYTLRRRGPLVVEDATTEPHLEPGALLIDDPPGSGITAPIPNGNETWGLLGVFCDDPRPFGEDVVRFVEQIVTLLAETIQRHDAEHKLQASEERFRQLAENASEGILRLKLTPERSCEYVNPALERITGFTAEELYTDPWLLHTNLHPDDQQPLNECLDEPERLQEPLDLRIQRADGQWRWIQLRSEPIVENGRITAIQAVVVDISRHVQQQQALESALRHEQQATDELRHVNELKDAFLQAVSHELRTPLTSVYGLATTLHRHSEALPKTKQSDLLGQLADNASQLRELLDDLLDVTRLTQDSIEPELQDVSLGRLAAAVADSIDFDGRALHLDLQPTPAQLEVTKIEHMIANLLNNAVKHTPEGTNIWMRLRAVDEGALLTVEDDGPGIPEHLHDSIFAPFEQGPEARHSPNPGTGIGLTLVARLAELHDGDVWVQNRPKGGASFKVLLPAAPS